MGWSQGEHHFALIFCGVTPRCLGRDLQIHARDVAFQSLKQGAIPGCIKQMMPCCVAYVQVNTVGTGLLAGARRVDDLTISYGQGGMI